ncbi:MAG: ParA family protein [Methanosarcinaceae archaeon]|nr:ParA family protein [Methanosarcinaceae archaeon]
MSKIITIHSSKGGTGKTSIAFNLACAYAISGKNVCLLDMDMRTPSSFHNLFPRPKRWFNDVLNGKCGINDIIVDATDEIGSEGKLYVGYSNPDIGAIRDISGKDRIWQARALKNLMTIRPELIRSDIDMILLDTPPGTDFISMNSIVASDYVLMVVKPGKCNLNCMKQMIDGVYSSLGKNYGVVENMYHKGQLSLCGSEVGIPSIMSIPCSCDVSVNGNCEVFTLTRTQHMFSTSIFDLMDKISDVLEIP